MRPAGRWETTGWWNAANALTAVIGYMRHTGDPSHREIIETTFAAARLEHAGFINGYFDDNGWWALAWVAAYDLTGESRYLGAARTIFARSGLPGLGAAGVAVAVRERPDRPGRPGQ
jgi:predicted alpha-1,6-mannanase (GH76 family)